MAEIKKYQCDICGAEKDTRDEVDNCITITNGNGHTWADVCDACVEATNEFLKGRATNQT